MNRRTFLKSMATVCGAAVVCPGELVKSPMTSITSGWIDNKSAPWIRGKDESYIEGEWHNFKVFSSEAERKKYRQNIIVKARQQGCTNSILYGIPYYFRGVPIHYQENLSA